MTTIMDNEHFFRAMLAMAKRRGQMFVTWGQGGVIPVEPPVPCRHAPHTDAETYSVDDVSFLVERHQKGDLFYAGGFNVLSRLPIRSDGPLLSYSITLCKPEWRIPSAIKIGDWIFTGPHHWDLVNKDFPYSPDLSISG